MGESEATLFTGKTSVSVRAFVVGDRIDTRPIETGDRLAEGLPLLVKAGDSGCAALFRYGAVVLFEVGAVEEASFLERLRTFVRDPVATAHGVEEATLHVSPEALEQADNGIITLHDFSAQRMQVVSEILAKSVVLEQYEEIVADTFGRIESVAATLRSGQSAGRSDRELLSHIGETHLIEHKLVHRVEVAEKPELLWDRPDLERLYMRLSTEYELPERRRALERKLELNARTVSTVLNIIEAERTLRVEWYIVILILVEIVLGLYELFIKK